MLYLLLRDEAGPPIVLVKDLAEAVVTYDHPVVQQEKFFVDLPRKPGERQALIGGFEKEKQLSTVYKNKVSY